MVKGGDASVLFGSRQPRVKMSLWGRNGFWTGASSMPRVLLSFCTPIGPPGASCTAPVPPWEREKQSVRCVDATRSIALTNRYLSRHKSSSRLKKMPQANTTSHMLLHGMVHSQGCPCYSAVTRRWRHTSRTFVYCCRHHVRPALRRDCAEVATQSRTAFLMSNVLKKRGIGFLCEASLFLITTTGS